MVKNFAYDKELTLLCKAVKKVYNKVIKGASFDVANKGAKDLVTNLDIASEEFLLNIIKTNFPEDTIISEEGNPEVLPKGRTWTVDPIDGTINFANGSECWGIQVSFSVDGVTEFAIIYMPDCRYFLYAARGFGAYCNNKKLQVVPYGDNSKITAIDFGKWVNKYYYDNMETIIENSLRVRTWGCGCFGFVSAATSQVGTYILTCNNPWDLLPGILICKEAGCHIYKGFCDTEQVTFVTANDKFAKKLGFKKKDMI